MQNFPRIVIALDLKKMNVPALCIYAKGIKIAGDPDVVNPPVTESDLHLQADELLDYHAGRITNKSTSATKVELDMAAKLRLSLTKVGRYVQEVANDVAIAHGSPDAGEEVVHRCGFNLKKKAEVHPRTFEIVKSGPGWTHLRVKAISRKTIYLWRFGITTAKGVIPEQFSPVLVTLECDIVINSQTSGAMYAYQMASVLPVSRSSKTNPTPTSITQNASLISATKERHATFDATADPYNWSDFIYEVCK